MSRLLGQFKKPGLTKKGGEPMAFSDFKSIAEVQAKFSIKASKEPLIGVEESLTPSEQMRMARRCGY